MKEPVPVPSLVLVVKAMVGLEVVAQQTPRAITGDPPSAVMFPPLIADKEVMLLAAVVESVGRDITLRVRVQVLPPMLSAKLAVPMEDGVPVMI